VQGLTVLSSRVKCCCCRYVAGHLVYHARALQSLMWLRAFACGQTFNTCLEMDGFNLATLDACWRRCRRAKLTQTTAAVRLFADSAHTALSTRILTHTHH
jgi:hypothetical protein